MSKGSPNWRGDSEGMGQAGRRHMNELNNLSEEEIWKDLMDNLEEIPDVNKLDNENFKDSDNKE